MAYFKNIEGADMAQTKTLQAMSSDDRSNGNWSIPPSPPVAPTVKPKSGLFPVNLSVDEAIMILASLVQGNFKINSPVTALVRNNVITNIFEESLFMKMIESNPGENNIRKCLGLMLILEINYAQFSANARTMGNIPPATVKKINKLLDVIWPAVQALDKADESALKSAKMELSSGIRGVRSRLIASKNRLEKLLPISSHINFLLTSITDKVPE